MRELDDVKSNDKQQTGVAGANRELHKSTYDMGMLDLRLQLIRIRSDYLNQINTQSTLLAGCAVGMLASGELQAMEATEGFDSQHWQWWTKKVCDFFYTFGSTACLAMSLWVIYTSMNLITLSMHSTLYGESMKAIVEADMIIESRMSEVRLVFVFSLTSLCLAVLAILAALADPQWVIMTFSIFAATGWHATASDDGTIRLYERYTGLDVKDRWRAGERVSRLRDLLTPYGYADAKTKVEKLHEVADPVMAAMLHEIGKKKKGVDELSAQSQAWIRMRNMGEPKDDDDEPKGSWVSSLQGSVQSSASFLQAQWRRRRKRSTDPTAGWLLKTASGEGPLEKVREMLAVGIHGDSINVAGWTVAATPRFSRWFVVRIKAGQLSIFTREEDAASGSSPKGHINDLHRYAVLRLAGADGMSTLGLLPRTSLQPSLPESPPGKDAPSEGKSWYLRGIDEQDTLFWCRVLRRAGAAAALDTTVDSPDSMPLQPDTNSGAGVVAVSGSAIMPKNPFRMSPKASRMSPRAPARATAISPRLGTPQTAGRSDKKTTILG